MVALPFPAFDQRRPFGKAEWKSVGTGMPTAVTRKENRRPAFVVAPEALVKVGGRRADVTGRVVGGTVLVVAGGTVLAVAAGDGTGTGTGTGAGAGAGAA